MLFIGRVRGYPVAREASLKLKEVSYIHAEAYPASELKHGPLALIEPALPTVAIVPDDDLLEKNRAAMEEIKARSGQILAVGQHQHQEKADQTIVVPQERGRAGPDPDGHPAPTPRLPHGLGPGPGHRQAEQPGEVGDGGVAAAPSARPQRGDQRVDRDGLDVGVERLAAGEDGLEAAQRRLRGAVAGGRADLGGAVGVHRGDLRAEAADQHVAVVAGQVDQRAVEGVAAVAGGAALLLLLEVALRARAERCAWAVPLPEPPAPSETASSSRSRSSRAAASAAASDSAAPTMASEPRNASDGERSARGRARTASRSSRASGTRARRRARPMCPPDTDAAHAAVASSMPSRSTSTAAIASGAGVRSRSARQRERMVTEMSSGCSEGQQSRNTVRSAGSSTDLSRAFDACSVRRSASSTMTTCQRAVVGRRAAMSIVVRTSLTPIERPSGTISRTSACVPASTVWQAVQCPQPWSGHCSAAAKARAATERPDPGGPVNSQAWVMAPTLLVAPRTSSPNRMPAACSAAACSSATAAGWPTT